VQAQTLTDWQAIVIDDASTDDSVARLAPIMAAEPRIRLIRLAQNGGAGRARNAGLAQAEGRWVAFLDADDAWHPEKLALQTRFMADEGLALSATAYRRVNAATGSVVAFGLPRRIRYRELLKTNVMGFSTVIYDRDRLGTRLMPELRQRQDFAFLLTLLRELPHAGGLNRVLCTYALGHRSLSSDKGDAARQTWRLYRDQSGAGAGRGRRGILANTPPARCCATRPRPLPARWGCCARPTPEPRRAHHAASLATGNAC